MAQYTRDPRWTVSRFQGKCAQCGRKIARGERIWFSPIGKQVLCERPCGETAARQFYAEIADERSP
jgi:hypothetical protein